MLVVDHEPHAWFLLRDDLGYVLDVNCNQSAVGFSVVIRLTAEETNLLEMHGRTAADNLARAIQGAPRAYMPRHRAELDAATVGAVERWQSDQPAA